LVAVGVGFRVWSEGPPVKPIQAIIVSFNLAAIIVAIVLTAVLVLTYDFHWYTALVLGLLAYIGLKVIFAVAVGFVWGEQDARAMKKSMDSLPPDVRQDVMDHTPDSDVKGTSEKLLRRGAAPPSLPHLIKCRRYAD
jgi:hypothetical protein